MFAFVSAAYRNGRVVRDPDAILQQGKDTCLDVENNNRTACCVWETDDWAAAYAGLVGKFIFISVWAIILTTCFVYRALCAVDHHASLRGAHVRRRRGHRAVVLRPAGYRRLQRNDGGYAEERVGSVVRVLSPRVLGPHRD